MLLEIRQRVNARSEKPIEGIILAVREGHLQKKLKDAEGIWLCGNFPDAELKGGMDCIRNPTRYYCFCWRKFLQGKKWMRKSCSIMRCCNVLWSW